MEFSDLITAYIEIGILGLCGVVVIFLFYKSIKGGQDKIKEEDKQKNDRFEEMINLLQEQNWNYQKQQSKLIENIVEKINNHVPSAEESEKVSKVANSIDEVLQKILIETNCSRACIVQYHNGGRGINKQSFLKMSMTNEQVKLGVKPAIAEFKDQFRNVLAYFVRELDDTDFCYISDFNDLKQIDISMYEFLNSRGIESKYGVALRNEVGSAIGFLCIEYINKDEADVMKIDTVMRSNRVALETLLNL